MAPSGVSGIAVGSRAVAEARHEPVVRATDAQLLRLFAEDRNEDAFTELVRRHGSVVLGVCRRALGDRHAAEDAFQLTFMVLARKAALLEHPELLSHWLYGVANRVARRAARQTLRRRSVEERLMRMRITSVSGLRPASSHLQSFIDDEINRLPAKYRLAIVACHVEGRTNRQAAQSLGWPEGTLVTRLNRAKQMLRNRAVERAGQECATALHHTLARRMSPGVVPAALIARAVRSAYTHTSAPLLQSTPLARPYQSLLRTAKAVAVGKAKGVALVLIAVSTVGLAIAIVRARPTRQHSPRAFALQTDLADFPAPMPAMPNATPDRAILDSVRAARSAVFARQPADRVAGKPESVKRPATLLGYADNAGTAPNVRDTLAGGTYGQFAKSVDVAASPLSASPASLRFARIPLWTDDDSFFNFLVGSSPKDVNWRITRDRQLVRLHVTTARTVEVDENIRGSELLVEFDMNHSGMPTLIRIERPLPDSSPSLPATRIWQCQMSWSAGLRAEEALERRVVVTQRSAAGMRLLSSSVRKFNDPSPQSAEQAFESDPLAALEDSLPPAQNLLLHAAD